MKALSLFTGIGGLDLAAEAAGIEIAAMCEIDPYCRAVLHRHWPEVPVHEDVRRLDGRNYAGIGIVYGGFPCQPYSGAGKRRGEDDPRALWGELARVVREARPRWVVAENVEGAVRLALDGMLDDLEEAGYACGAHLVDARCSGLRFRGRRLFVVAKAVDGGAPVRGERELEADGAPPRGGGDHAGRAPLARLWRGRQEQPRPPGVADGVPHRVDRIRAIGNAVAPAQAYPFFEAIMRLERGEAPREAAR